MTKNAIKFITDIVRPWEKLNSELSVPYTVDPEISDYTNIGDSLSVSIKHMPEYCLGLKPRELIKESLDYKIISDLADSSKHGELSNSNRICGLEIGLLFERNSDGLVRFLRNKMYLEHKIYGRIDFMELSIKSAKFVSDKIGFNIDWNPIIINNKGPFTDEINVHVSSKNQINWSGMQLHFIQKNKKGEMEYVDLNSSVTLTITSDMHNKQ